MSALLGFDPEALLAAGYALFLAVASFALEALGRSASRRAARYRTAGFTYRRELDAWECPTGQRLWRTGGDEARGLVRWRALARACNGCPLKRNCTDSDQGREIVESVNPWLSSDIGRFHGALSLALLALGLLILAVATVRNPSLADRLVLAATLAVLLAAGRRLRRAARARGADASGRRGSRFL